MKLNEVGNITNKVQLEKWLRDNGFTEYHIYDDLSVDIVGDVNLNNIREEGEPIPIKFRNVYGGFSTGGGDLYNLKGAPEFISEYLDCSANNLESLEYFPKVIKGDVHMYLNSIDSFKGIHLHIKEINGYLKCDLITKNLLGVFFIKGLKGIDYEYSDNKDDYPEHMQDIIKIVDYNLKNGDVHSCQEELIEAGFPEAARF